jgi:CBS domain-containing protein
MHLKEIMSQPVVTCPVDSMLDAPARLMWEFDCGVIPLVKDDGRLVGIITDRDICMAALSQGKPLHAIGASSAMAGCPVACHVDDTVEAAEHLMREAQVRRIPVIDGEGRPVGVVSTNDLARLAARAKKSGVDRELVQTLAAVSRPRARAVPLSNGAMAPAVPA